MNECDIGQDGWTEPTDTGGNDNTPPAKFGQGVKTFFFFVTQEEKMQFHNLAIIIHQDHPNEFFRDY